MHVRVTQVVAAVVIRVRAALAAVLVRVDTSIIP